MEKLNLKVNPITGWANENMKSTGILANERSKTYQKQEKEIAKSIADYKKEKPPLTKYGRAVKRTPEKPISPSNPNQKCK